MSRLQIRLKNCIQTILELEPGMRAAGAGPSFDEDFASLKTFLSRIDSMNLAEEDVRRLEGVTGTLLAELGLSRRWNAQGQRLLQ
ncbi:MAG: hypothetical protein HDQ94_02025 [Desulfovibrio sp.]|nr:hypothetical protein [Desulfovibrio sp.]